MFKHSSVIQSVEYHPTRLVLIEKCIPKLQLFLQKIKSPRFTTEVYPLSDNGYLIYQENYVLAEKIFGKQKSKHHPKIVICRVFILKKQLFDKNSKLLEVLLTRNNPYFSFYNEDSYELFVHGDRLSFSSIVAIPETGKHMFIKYCSSYLLLRGKQHSLERMPIYKIGFNGSYFKIDAETFLSEIDIYHHHGFPPFSQKERIKEYKKIKQPIIPLFNYYVSLYGDGDWECHNKVSKWKANKELNCFTNKKVRTTY